jgi:hypothetical protein
MDHPFRLKTYIWPLIGCLTRLRRPWLVSRALLAVTKKLEFSSTRSPHPQPYRRILVLSSNKAGVLQDIEETFANAHDYELAIWPSYALRAIARAMLAPGLSHDRYITNDPAIEATKSNYRRFLKEVWRHFTTGHPVDAVIGVNFGYYVQREFAAALEESGTPFIVLQKENLNGITPRRADFWRVVYEKGRGKFAGRKILVYNDIERELQISSGIIEPNNVIVTGMPRLDRVHQWRRANAGSEIQRRQVLFFGFSRKDKVPGRSIKKLKAKGLLSTAAELEEASQQWSELGWDELCTGACQGIAEFARSRPDVQVIVKTKGQTIQIEETTELLKNGGELPSNIQVVKGGDPFELIAQSSVVVGFNTTGLIEAVAAGKPTVVPWFGEVHNETLRDIILDLADAVDYAHSPAELVERISICIETGITVPAELPESSVKMLRRLVGNDDGAASARVLRAVDAEIGRIKQPLRDNPRDTA